MPGFAALDPEEPVKLPLEARDFGMYVGFIAVWAYLSAIGRGRVKGMPPAPILVTLVLFVGVMGLDGVNAFVYDLQKNLPMVPYLYEPRLQLRLATGLLTGIAFGGILTPVVNFSLWRAEDNRPIIANWKQVLVALADLRRAVRRQRIALRHSAVSVGDHHERERANSRRLDQHGLFVVPLSQRRARRYVVRRAQSVRGGRIFGTDRTGRVVVDAVRRVGDDDIAVIRQSVISQSVTSCLIEG